MDHTPSRRLSEISHLFLSDVRKKQTGSDARPSRTPPQAKPAGAFRSDVSVDMTPEEFENMLRPPSLSSPLPAEPAVAYKPVRAVVAHHLGETMTDHVRDLAVALNQGQRVGVIYADAANVRVCCVDSAATESVEEPAPEPLTAAALREVVVELNNDVSEWLLVLPDPKAADARDLLAAATRWTLLTGTDHDTVVTAYRTLKSAAGDAKPDVTVCVFDATGEDEADKTYRKLAGVCEQFLKLPTTRGVDVNAVEAAEHCLLDASAVDDRAVGAHWAVLAELVGVGQPARPAGTIASKPPVVTRAVAVVPPAPVPPTPAASAAPTFAPPADPVPIMTISDDYQPILDLPDADASPAAILKAVVRGGTEWVESPVKAPALPDATVAVGRDRRLVLLAVARQGLGELRSIGSAYRWLTENRQLIAMATPQCAVDPNAEPRLHLLVDPTDASADALQPLRIGGGVSIAAYRKLRWGGKTGLMLEAA